MQEKGGEKPNYHPTTPSPLLYWEFRLLFIATVIHLTEGWRSDTPRFIFYSSPTNRGLERQNENQNEISVKYKNNMCREMFCHSSQEGRLQKKTKTSAPSEFLQDDNKNTLFSNKVNEK